MRTFLNYMTPDGNVVWGEKPVNMDMVGYNSWLEVMVNESEVSKEFIFFYTIDSTDVFHTPDGARLTDNRDNVWRLLADGEWICVDGPDRGEYATREYINHTRGPVLQFDTMDDLIDHYSKDVS